MNSEEEQSILITFSRNSSFLTLLKTSVSARLLLQHKDTIDLQMLTDFKQTVIKRNERTPDYMIKEALPYLVGRKGF